MLQLFHFLFFRQPMQFLTSSIINNQSVIMFILHSQCMYVYVYTHAHTHTNTENTQDKFLRHTLQITMVYY